MTDGLLITHGAGGNSRMPLLLAADAAFTAAGLRVIRYDLPFRQKRPTGPPSGKGEADREGLRQTIAELRTQISGRLFIGGQSYGGRQCSVVAAEDASLADGLLLLSYPLHPPGKPDQLRTAHFAQIQCPCVFVHGARDPFATSEELAQTTAALNATTITLAKAGHDLAAGKFDWQPVINAILRAPSPNPAA